jgi:hypothetical protein
MVYIMVGEKPLNPSNLCTCFIKFRIALFFIFKDKNDLSDFCKLIVIAPKQKNTKSNTINEHT